MPLPICGLNVLCALHQPALHGVSWTPTAALNVLRSSAAARTTLILSWLATVNVVRAATVSLLWVWLVRSVAGADQRVAFDDPGNTVLGDQAPLLRGALPFFLCLGLQV
uniref:Uncharacterized protein n=1 Tax=Haptolina brevifila TaxID=156173 RepID=A0A7S2IM76_9EUKA|mmetsp:Transcript_67973/g.134738  ORF Transcript_67973/g.134738 Transcript_67973/m.134738 type:complete len:109 (+) Transcript_67973:82-408(+)